MKVLAGHTLTQCRAKGKAEKWNNGKAKQEKRKEQEAKQVTN